MATGKARRALNGHGSVFYVDSEKRWRASYYDSHGKRRTLSGRTREAVTERLDQVRAADKAGNLGPLPSQMPNLAEWLQIWLARKERTVTWSTYRGYAHTVRRLPTVLARKKLDHLRRSDFEDFYWSLKDAGLSPSTVRSAHIALSGAMKAAVKDEYLARNPCEHAELPKLRTAPVGYLSLEEVRRVLAAVSTTDARARWLLALTVGLRQGEALGLRWADVDLEAGTLTVRHQLQRQTGRGLILTTPKSKAGNRTVRLSGVLVEALRAQRVAHLEQRLLLGEQWHDLDFVFPSSTGTPRDPRNDNRAWKALLRTAKVPSVRLHDARHTAATLYLSGGVHARVVMEILGHSQISHTLNTYTHVPSPLLQAAADQVEALILDVG